MIYENVTFLNGRIDRSWYTGTRSIEALEFSDCKLSYIASDAFDAQPFVDLEALRFIAVDHLEWHIGSFNVLYTVYIDRTALQMTPSFLTPLRFTLTSFDYNSYPVDGFLKDLLGPADLNALTTLVLIGRPCIGCTTPLPYRSLHADNFTTLIRIRYLALIGMYISHIESDAFDDIGESLEELSLEGNTLQAIQARWFATFFDTFSTYLKKITYHNNEFLCDCEFFMVNNMTYHLRPRPVGDSVAIPCKHLNVDANCPQLQILTKEKLLLTDSPVAIFSYPRVQLRLNVDKLLVNTEFQLTLRILMQKHVRTEIRRPTKCPSREWLRDSVACIRLTTNVVSIDIADILDESNVTIFFAILLHPNKRVWPMHVHTVRATERDNAAAAAAAKFRVIAIAMMVMFSALGAIVGVLTAWFWHALREDKVAVEPLPVVQSTDVIPDYIK